MFVVILGRRKRTEKIELQGCRRSRSNHCQEPLAGASRVFPDNPFCQRRRVKRSSERVKRSSRRVKRSSRRVKRISKRVKRSSRQTEVKIACEGIRQGQIKRTKAPGEKTFNLCERLLGRFVCRSSLFVHGEVFENKERTEL